jgi:predicted NAD-dependent protein-ADP-ribosyltransferase YbiA (DUF1768 family)
MAISIRTGKGIPENVLIFAADSIIVNGKEWCNVRQYYLAMQCTDPILQESIRNTHEFSDALELVKGIPQRPTQIKSKTLTVALFANFTQNEHDREQLLGTWPHELEDVHDPSGNTIGKILMIIRNAFLKANAL